MTTASKAAVDQVHNALNARDYRGAERHNQAAQALAILSLGDRIARLAAAVEKLAPASEVKP